MEVIYCELVNSLEGDNKSLYFNWAVKNVGFGQLYFYESDGDILCDNELMSKNFIFEVISHFVDNLIMIEDCSKNKSINWKNLVVKVEPIDDENCKNLCFNNVTRKDIKNELFRVIEKSTLTCER